MNYLICKDWSNTTNNHAGIKYLCSYLQNQYKGEFKVVVEPAKLKKPSKGFFKRKLDFLLEWYKSCKHYKNTSRELLDVLKDGDSVFLMEYLDKYIGQYYIAEKINKNVTGVKVFGMAHLSPLKLKLMFSDAEIVKWVDPLTKVITLGSSLSSFLEESGVDKNKISTTFHYLDKYYDVETIESHEEFRVIAMGNQMRDIDTLAEVTKRCRDMKFYVCQGMLELQEVFTTPNVELIPFVEESELRNLMKISDVSLNTMIDTVGSNVIVTSMGMGNAMVCSDVGSIRNYCDESNTFFCSNVYEFCYSLNKLKEDNALCHKMRSASYEMSKKYSIDKFYQYLKTEILTN